MTEVNQPLAGEVLAREREFLQGRQLSQGRQCGVGQYLAFDFQFFEIFRPAQSQQGVRRGVFVQDEVEVGQPA